MLTSLGILFYLFFPTDCARAIESPKLIFRGHRIPFEVDLKANFNPEVAIQAGGTCSLFSAAELFEESCFRTTGKHVKISKALLLMLHLKDQSHSFPFDLTQTCSPEHLLPKDRQGNPGEAGWPMETVRRIHSGFVCQGSQFPLRDSTLKQIRALNAASVGHPETLPGFRRELCSVAEKEIKCLLPNSSFDANGKLIYATEDPVLKACLEKGLAARYESFEGRDRLGITLALLTRGIPFLCVGSIDGIAAKRGEHSYVIRGYKYNPATAGQFSYISRDTNKNTPEEWTLGCKSFLYFSNEPIGPLTEKNARR